MKEPPNEIKKAILERRIALWTNTLYEAQVQARVATVIDNGRLLQEAQAKADEAIRALDTLQQFIAELTEAAI